MKPIWHYCLGSGAVMYIVFAVFSQGTVNTTTPDPNIPQSVKAMTYPDRVRFEYTDWLDRKGSGLYYFPELSDPLVLGDFVTAVVQVIEPAYNVDGLKKIIVVELAEEGPYASHTDQMIFEFTTAGDNYEVVITGPKATNFEPDTVTVDISNPDISDLIAFLIANGTDEDGNPLLAYVQGYRQTVLSAAQELLNASDYFTVGQTSAEFYIQHGMDVMVRP